MDDQNDVHVRPLDDLIDHPLTVTCACRPTVEECPTGRLVVHNSADGREYFEPNGPVYQERPAS